MRLIFAGTPEFACTALAALHGRGFDIALVLTQPDRPAGRGMRVQTSAVKQFALEHRLLLAQPRSLRLDGKFPQDALYAQQAMEAACADAMVVAAYGLILPQWVLDAMRIPKPGVATSGLGCLNIHASLLPRWRGAAPIHRAIEAGDAETGVTIMQMDAGLDTGAVLRVGVATIHPGDTMGSLHDRMADLGARLIVDVLHDATKGSLNPISQPTQGVTYANKVTKEEGMIDWRDDGQAIVRRIRAFDPSPGCQSLLNGHALKIWAAHTEPLASATVPSADFGQIVAIDPMGVRVIAMKCIVVMTELQRAGGRRMPVSEFIRGAELRVGMRFALPVAESAQATGPEAVVR